MQDELGSLSTQQTEVYEELQKKRRQVPPYDLTLSYHICAFVLILPPCPNLVARVGVSAVAFGIIHCLNCFLVLLFILLWTP
jgi:hypothetical protein